MQIRPERSEDAAAISAVTEAAFATAPHSEGTEANIVDALRRSGALTLSLVAVDGETVVGHVAFSPIRINGALDRWFGLGPISVRPDQQHHRIGTRLVQEGLRRLQVLKADGCVVFGDPLYYGRFGFESHPRLVYADADADALEGYFQRLVFEGDAPAGTVVYPPGFQATEE